jgi:hypothetical protein
LVVVLASQRAVDIIRKEFRAIADVAVWWKKFSG